MGLTDMFVQLVTVIETGGEERRRGADRRGGRDRRTRLGEGKRGKEKRSREVFMCLSRKFFVGTNE